jgi:hypothetical protein
MKLVLLFVFAALSGLGQTNLVAPARPTETQPAVPVQISNNLAGENLAVLQHVEELRAACIQNRRIICGKILKVLPDGIVVDSGYTNLMRAPLNQSWLIPGTVVAGRASNLVEESSPDSTCLGQVFLTDLPKPPRGTRLHVFDYVILEGFPMGQYTYASVGDVKHTVREFSTKVANAVRWMYGQEEGETPPQK